MAKSKSVTLSKQRLHMPRDDRGLIEVRVESGKREGRVLYGLNGRVVEIGKPQAKIYQ
jgi:hypothetical protein